MPIQDLFNDPQFYTLNDADRRKVLTSLDPAFEDLDDAGMKKFYNAKLAQFHEKNRAAEVAIQPKPPSVFGDYGLPEITEGAKRFGGALYGVAEFGKELAKGALQPYSAYKTLVEEPYHEMGRRAEAAGSGLEKFGYRAAQALPVVGPFAARAGELTGTALAGEMGYVSPKEQLGAVGELAGYAAAPKIISKAVKAPREMLYESIVKNKQKAYGNIANALLAPEGDPHLARTLDEAMPLVLDYTQKGSAPITATAMEGKAVNLIDKPLEPPIVESIVPELTPKAKVNPPRLGSSLKEFRVKVHEATQKYYNELIKPLEIMFGDQPVNTEPIIQAGLNSIKKITSPAEQARLAKEVHRLFDGPKTLSELENLRKELNQKLTSFEAKNNVSRRQALGDQKVAFLDAVENAVRQVFDNRLDEFSQAAGGKLDARSMYRGYRSLRDLSDRVDIAHSINENAKILQKGKRGSLIQPVERVTGAVAGLWGEKAAALHQMSRTITGRMNMPDALIKTASDNLELGGTLGRQPTKVGLPSVAPGIKAVPEPIPTVMPRPGLEGEMFPPVLPPEPPKLGEGSVEGQVAPSLPEVAPPAGLNILKSIWGSQRGSFSNKPAEVPPKIEPTTGLYSRLEHNLDNLPQEEFKSGQAALKAINENKKYPFPKFELTYAELDKFLQNYKGPITKAQIKEYYDNNKLVLKSKTLPEPRPPEPEELTQKRRELAEREQEARTTHGPDEFDWPDEAYNPIRDLRYDISDLEHEFQRAHPAADPLFPTPGYRDPFGATEDPGTYFEKVDYIEPRTRDTILGQPRTVRPTEEVVRDISAKIEKIPDQEISDHGYYKSDMTGPSANAYDISNFVDAIEYNVRNEPVGTFYRDRSQKLHDAIGPDLIKEFKKAKIEDDIEAYPERNPNVYTEGHYGGVAPNVISHQRGEIRTKADGTKQYALQESQADFAQRARDVGTRKGLFTRKELVRLRELNQIHSSQRTPEEAVEFRELSNKMHAMPDLPLTKDADYLDVAIKRTIVDATKAGADEIVWPSGQVQAARWHQHKAFNKIEVTWDPDDPLYVKVTGYDSRDRIVLATEKVRVKRVFEKDATPDIPATDLSQTPLPLDRNLDAETRAKLFSSAPEYDSSTGAMTWTLKGRGEKAIEYVNTSKKNLYGSVPASSEFTPEQLGMQGDRFNAIYEKLGWKPRVEGSEIVYTKIPQAGEKVYDGPARNAWDVRRLKSISDDPSITTNPFTKKEFTPQERAKISEYSFRTYLDSLMYSLERGGVLENLLGDTTRGEFTAKIFGGKLSPAQTQTISVPSHGVKIPKKEAEETIKKGIPMAKLGPVAPPREYVA